MSYCLEIDSHVRNKIKVELDFSNYATKQEVEHSKDIDTSGLAEVKLS